MPDAPDPDWPRETRFERQEPWVADAPGPLRLALWQFLATSSLVFGTWYIWWRWTASLNPDALWFSIPLALAETMAFFGLILYTVNLWTPRGPRQRELPVTLFDTIGIEDRDGTDRPVAVDVFFATYNEDPEIVRQGLRSAKDLAYPHEIRIKIHVLDDGRRPAMAAVAQDEGANYITRNDNVGYKAGNLRNAMESTSGDFIIICDADTILFPDFLTETMGYFRDARVAWVQTPQWFWDIPPGVPVWAAWRRRLGRVGERLGHAVEWLVGPVRFGTDPFANDPQMFYDFILRRRNWANAAFCCGASSIHRREAIMETAVRIWADRVDRDTLADDKAVRRLTGEAVIFAAVHDSARMSRAREIDFTPFKLHVSEDIYTSIQMHSDRWRRWRSVMHPKIVSRMMSPSDMLSWTIQRYKYAGGTLDIVFHDNPLFQRGLSLPQKLMYGATFYSYLSPIWNVMFFIAPIIFLTTGIAPVATFSLEFFLHLIPFLLLNELAQLVGLWGTSVMGGRRWHLAMFPVTLGALWSVLRGKRIAFPVTPKDRTEGRFLRLVKWQIAFSIAILGSLGLGWIYFLLGEPGYSLGAIITNTVWSLNNFLSLWVMIRAATWSPDPEFDKPVMEGYRDETA
ncbi:glycosyltransferase [Roseicyclus marinus]|uniref:glycosyltransferase n=1 Tax=Roseicyclus marinus TaxID=2161673 RepID=UPI00240FE022|nr:glycosyltransferase [Roseicyclus marinus]MDG3039785.1 glycosyltransferase [Roseicyclus marinus]